MASKFLAVFNDLAKEIQRERDSLACGGNQLGRPSFLNNNGFCRIKNIISYSVL
jgi:hypothetical protein